MLRALISALVFATMLQLTGCYDNRETDSLATVMAVGVDESEKKDFKKYTFAIANTGGLAGVDKGDGTSLICFSAEGADADEAIEHLSAGMSKELSFSHLSSLLFSKSVAENGMYGDVDYFDRKISVRPQTMVAVTDMEAGEYLHGLKPSLEANPEKYFRKIFKNRSLGITDMSISDFINAYYTQKAITVPVIGCVSEDGQYTEANCFVNKKARVYDGRLMPEAEE